MSTASAPTSPAADVAPATARVPFTRLVAVELRKLYDTRAGMWLLISIVGITAAVMVIGALSMKSADKTVDNFMGLAGIPQGILLPILGIMAVTSEWSQRTGLTTFTLEPRRLRVMGAKIVAAVVLAIVALVIVVALGGLLWTVAGTGDWTLGAVQLGELVVGQVLGILFGLAFGMALLNTPAAIVAYFALPTAWSIALGIAGDRLEFFQRWFDTGTTTTPLFNHEMDGTAWTRLAVSHLVWVGIPLAVGLWRVLHREVKSA